MVRLDVDALTRDFQDLLQLLGEHGVRFLVVGGYAVAAHGHPRYTNDTRVDAMFGPTSVPIIARLSLITNKRASGRPQDLADVAKLERGPR